MSQTRRIVRNALRDALAHATTGFNQKFGPLMAAYGTEKYAFGIDFQPGSRNFFIGYLQPDQLEMAAQLAEFPALVIYTSSSENQLLSMPTTFSGFIVAHADFYLRYRLRDPGSEGGIEVDDTDSIGDAVEDAFYESLYAFTAWPTGVLFSRRIECSRDPVVLRDDGWEQGLPFVILFQVDA